MHRYLLPVLTFFLLLVLWQLAVIWFRVETWILPSPLQIINAFWQSRTLMITHLTPTLTVTFIGFSGAVASGAIIAVCMEKSALLKHILYPLLILSQTIPFIILAPLLTVWLGFGMLPKILLVTLVCFFPIALNLYEGFRTADPAFKKMLVSMGASGGQIFTQVVWPGSLPALFSGMKIAASYSVLAAVISEWVGSDAGLGILLVRSAKSYLTDRVFAVTGVITLLSIAAVGMIEIFARLSIPWHYQRLHNDTHDKKNTF